MKETQKENLQEIIAEAGQIGGWLNNERTAVYTVRIARAKTGELVFIDSDDDSAEPGREFQLRDLLDDWRLWPDAVNGLEIIPAVRAVYVCRLQVKSVRYPATVDGPTEYDIVYTVIEAKPLIGNNLAFLQPPAGPLRDGGEK